MASVDVPGTLTGLAVTAGRLNADNGARRPGQPGTHADPDADADAEPDGDARAAGVHTDAAGLDAHPDATPGRPRRRPPRPGGSRSHR